MSDWPHRNRARIRTAFRPKFPVPRHRPPLGLAGDPPGHLGLPPGTAPGMVRTMLSRHSSGFLAIIALCVLAGCTTTSNPTLVNLDLAKERVNAYVDSGAYAQEISVVAAQAREWITQRTRQKQAGERLAIVLDIDETALSNLPIMRSVSYGYYETLWDQWIAEAKAPAIDAVHAVYRTARERGVSIFFITGRLEHHRPGTEANLKAAGYSVYASLICKPDGDRSPTSAYKTAQREKITTRGYTVIANIGDQQSDLDGGFAEKTFKLPNPFYLMK